MRGALTATGKQGANTFTFDGRIGGRRLAPGSYVLTATPTVGGGPGAARTVAFKIVR